VSWGRLVKIGDHVIGGPRCFVIAEAGVNHNGDPDLARRLVDIAADAGADAIKFQTFDPAALVTADAPKAAYQQRNDGTARTQRQMLDALVLPHQLHRELQHRAQARGVMFLSTPFDEGSADFLVDLGVPALKVGSGELTNHLLLQHLARKRLPLLLSTGMAVLDEIAAALAVIRAAGDPPVALFHCVSNYPCAPDEANLHSMATLRDRFGLPTGWSDHTLGIDVALAGVALGAQLLEKHFTMDRSLPGPDHLASLEPGELAALVRGVRAVESALGTGEKAPSPAERAVALVARRSLYWRRTLPAGAIVATGDLQALRPGDGVSADRIGELIGRRMTRAVAAGTRIAIDDVTDAGDAP
jgi:N,N'-diacetyllegionaminate synthase